MTADPIAPLRETLDALGAALAVWCARDDRLCQPEATRSAGTAIDAIDDMTGALYALRQRLVTESRTHEEIGDARRDRLLAASRSERARVDAILNRSFN